MQGLFSYYGCMDFLPQYINELILLFGCTAFLKIATVFSIVRYGLGLPDILFGILAAGAALVFACAVPQAPIVPGNVAGSVWEQAEGQREFLAAHADGTTAERFDSIRSRMTAHVPAKAEGAAAQPDAPAPDEATPAAAHLLEPSIQSLLAAFIVQELSEAFQLGLLLLIPLVVIDILVVNVLAVLGITQISAVVISLPLKLALFLGAGGWELLVTKLLNSYGG